MHRAPFIGATNLFAFTKEEPLDKYVERYISKRLKTIYTSDLGSSLFLNDVFFWDNYRKMPNDGVGHYFSMKRVKRLIANHEPLIIKWLDYIDRLALRNSVSNP